jgi:hypothetical protein
MRLSVMRVMRSSEKLPRKLDDSKLFLMTSPSPDLHSSSAGANPTTGKEKGDAGHPG